MSYDNTNSGAVFVNDRKSNDSQPDRKGSINIEGREFWLSGWLKKDKNGKPFLSLKATPKDEQKPAPKPAPVSAPEPQDDIPF